MKLSETENVFPVRVAVEPGAVSAEIVLYGYYSGLDAEVGISLDATTAAELIIVLQHFIETGELPQ